MVMQRIMLYSLLFLLLPTLTHAKIVFRSVERSIGGGIYVMDDDGRNAQRLTDGGWWPVWSPDGKQIAFIKEPPGAPNWPQKSAIYIINSDGSNEHRFTNEDTVEWTPSWSPDGRHIAFKSNRLDRSDIWTINLTTKEMRRLTRTDSLTTFPSWSPNGKYIVYHESSSIYLMRADGSRQQELVKGDMFRQRNFPRWSPDSQSVVYAEDTSALGVGGRLVTVSDKVVIHNINTDKRQVVDTPDDWSIHSACFMGSKKLLISAKGRDSNPDRYEIYRYHLVTGEIVNLTNTTDDDYAMDWISDTAFSVTARSKKILQWGTLKK